MVITPEIEQKLNSTTTLLERVKILLNDAQEPEVMYNKLPGTVETVDDIALVQCFYGTDISRIRATMQALEFNLQMTRKPSTWVFVECQKEKSDCAFAWLSKYGAKYIFVQMKPENEGIMLKNPLWNIGANNCTESRLCFVDSDIVMCNSDWISRAVDAFDSGNDVLSLASHQYYQSDTSCKLYETIGYKWKTQNTVEHGHVGLTLGLTRKIFDKIGGLDPAIILDDVHTYHKILGNEMFKSFSHWTEPFDLPLENCHGYNIELGYVDNVACHIWHGADESKYDDLTKLLVASGVKSIYDMMGYSSNTSNLPSWREDSTKCIAIKKTIIKYYNQLKQYELEQDKPEFDIVSEFYSELGNTLGEPDADHPLFVCTVVKDRFGLKLDDFTRFRDRVEEGFFGAKTQPVVLFFSDCEKFDFKEVNLNVVQLKDYNPLDEFSQCMRKDLKYPDGVVVYYIPFGLDKFNTNICIPSEKLEFPDGTVIVSNIK